MPTPTAVTPAGPTEFDIFTRIWDSVELTPEVAEHVLAMKFAAEDVARIHYLAAQSRAGRLTDAEDAEYENFIRVGDQLGILQSKARQLVRKKPARRPADG